MIRRRFPHFHDSVEKHPGCPGLEPMCPLKQVLTEASNASIVFGVVKLFMSSSSPDVPKKLIALREIRDKARDSDKVLSQDGSHFLCRVCQLRLSQTSRDHG